MKKNEERIINYLSELMRGDERIQFERDLASSKELNDDFNEVKSRLDSIILSAQPEADERYFASILPRVRANLGRSSKKAFRKFAYYFTPSAAAVVILSLVLFNSNNSIEPQYIQLAKEVINNFSDQEVSERYLTDLESTPGGLYSVPVSEDLSVEIPEELEIKNDSYIRLLDSPAANEYGTLNRLSDNDLEIVYAKLNSTTSPKVMK